MNTRTGLFLPILLMLSLPHSLAAQDAPEPPPYWTGSAELGFVATSGNSESSSIGIGSELGYDDGLWNNRGRIRYVQIESEGELTAESLDGLLHIARAMRENLDTFGEATYLRNSFAGIDNRYAVAAGLTWEVVATETRELDFSAGLGYTNEDLVQQSDRSFATGVSSMFFRHGFSERSWFENTADLNLNLEEGDDWRARNVAALVAGLTKLVSMKFSVDVRYQNEPVQGFERTDTVTSAALVAKF